MFLFAWSLHSPSAWAQQRGLGFQAHFKNPQGIYPSVTGVSVKTQILTPSGTCVLREETHANKDLVSGNLSLAIGGPGAIAVGGNNPAPVLSLSDSLNNSKIVNGLTCVDSNDGIISTGQSYTPLTGDGRILRLRLTIPGDGEVVADFNIRSTAFAIHAETLNGKVPADFINVNSGSNLTQLNIESLFQQITKLNALLTNYNVGGTALQGDSDGDPNTANNVSGTVSLANGGTGATNAADALTNLGLGPLATMSVTGTPDNTKFLRGDGTWQVVNTGAILPDQSGHTGEFLTTNGSVVSWSTVNGTSQWQDGPGSSINFMVGHVGIGTTTPSAPLSISTASNDNIIMSGNANGQAVVKRGAATGSLLLRGGTTDTDGATLFLLGNSDTADAPYEGGATFMLGKSTSLFTVQDPSYQDIMHVNTYGGVELIDSFTGLPYLKTTAPSQGTIGMYVKGSVGIGTTTPSAPLVVTRSTPGTITSSGTTLTGTGTTFRTTFTPGDMIVDLRGNTQTIATIASDTSMTTVGTFSPALTNSAYLRVGAILNGGNVGIGTSRPIDSLNIVNDYGSFVKGGGITIQTISSNPDWYHSTITGRTTTGTLASPSTSQSGDILLSLTGQSNGGGWASAASIAFASDGNAAFLSTPGRIIFSTTPSGSNSLVERMRMTSIGYLGLGNTSPSNLLHVGSAAISSGSAVASFQNSDGTCTITPAASGSGIACSSDERLKENFDEVDGEEALENIQKLQAFTYNFKTSARENLHTGYKAQDLQKIAPEFVRKNDDGYFQVYYDALIPWITESIKILSQRITDLRENQKAQDSKIDQKANKIEIESLKSENAAHKAEIQKLKKENAEMKDRLQKIENMIHER